MAQRRPRPGRGERAHIGWAADVGEWTAPTRDVEASERIRPAAPRNDLLLERSGRGLSAARITRRREAALWERAGGGWSGCVATTIVPAWRSSQQCRYSSVVI